jgi:hypothetical protein
MFAAGRLNSEYMSPFGDILIQERPLKAVPFWPNPCAMPALTEAVSASLPLAGCSYPPGVPLSSERQRYQVAIEV